MDKNLIDYREMGRRIQNVRQEKKLTQKELAERSGLCSSFVCHIERGLKRGSIESIAAICRALEVDAHYLLFGEHWAE